MGKITGFLEFERVEETYEPKEQRRKHFREFIPRLTDEQAKIQGARCMDCGIPFCMSGCPVNNIIPDWNDLVYRHQWKAAIEALKSGHLGSLGLDVYEEEGTLFFADHSQTAIQDDVFARLLTFPNVLITGHQGFFTAEALAAIAETTLASVTEFEQGRPLTCRVAVAAAPGL